MATRDRFRRGDGPGDRDPERDSDPNAIAPPVPIPPLALRAADAARALGISARQLWSLTNAGEIPHARIGRSIAYPVDELREWLSRRARSGRGARRARDVGRDRNEGSEGSDP